MTLAATVLIPTHDHGPTLLRSVGSALAQTVPELEVLVIGDGVPDVTRELMAEVTADDERVRFFDHPKGPRHGELYRHAALQEACGEIVCYLCDDDLWLPGHVEHLRELLRESDFAYSLPFWIDPDGEAHPLRVDLRLHRFQALFRSGGNRIPLSHAGHTLELYRRLPEGWRTTPDGIYTDLYMWQQILAVPGCRVAGGARPTVIHLPSPERKGWSTARRVAELDRYTARLADPGFSAELAERVLGATVADAAALEAAYDELEEEARRAHAAAGELDARLRESEAERVELGEELRTIATSVTWRLRGRLLAIPGLSGLLKAAARALAARAGR
ncbi:MAG TPA: glycosyltransferase family A protein [Gaiellaceae bacterium]|nr:glycosyltransferase family A protein [Gaiellaceae bacterium]